MIRHILLAQTGGESMLIPLPDGTPLWVQIGFSLAAIIAPLILSYLALQKTGKVGQNEAMLKKMQIQQDEMIADKTREQTTLSLVREQIQSHDRQTESIAKLADSIRENYQSTRENERQHSDDIRALTSRIGDMTSVIEIQSGHYASITGLMTELTHTTRAAKSANDNMNQEFLKILGVLEEQKNSFVAMIEQLKNSNSTMIQRGELDNLRDTVLKSVSTLEEKLEGAINAQKEVKPAILEVVETSKINESEKEFSQNENSL